MVSRSLVTLVVHAIKERFFVRYSVIKGKSPMEDSKTQLSSGYAMGPPWLFKGSALYQLHLVKAEVARVFIPKEFKLVEAFGYTLGGFFLARYDDSPVAKFDEALCGAAQVLARGLPKC